MKFLLPLALLCALGLGAPAAFAQGSTARIGARAQPPAPPATTAVANPVLPGGPSASGLASPFPASAPTLAVPGTSAAGTTTPDTDPTAPLPGAENTAVMGAGPYGTRGLARATAPGPVSPVEVARSFLMADGNRDGELTRAEAMRLALMPLSFEEMDANHDDRLTRSEYEEALR